MPSMKEIKNRIKSVENTRQITKAMELVATSKMKKAKERIEKSRPFFETLSEALSDIAASNKDFSSPFTHKNKSEKACHIVIAGDRGLAGGYNNNLFKSLNYNDGDIIFPIGKKVVDYFSKKDVTFFTTAYEVAADVTLSDCNSIGQALADAFIKEDFSSIDIYYTGFVNALTQTPASKAILPITSTETLKKSHLIIYDPSPETVFSQIVPHYISGIIYGGLCESLASELSARRTAMEAATDNAGEIIDELSLKYNRARQAAITQELTEIVAGSN